MIKVQNYFIATYGITTVVVFILMLTFGGLFNSVQTMYFREISYLISPYSLYEYVTVPLYRLYNVNLLLFSVVLLIRLKNKFAKLGTLYLAMSAVTSLLLVEVPMDPFLQSRSPTGFSHIIVTLLTASFTFIAIWLFSYSFKENKRLVGLSRYSFSVSMIILVGGLIATVFALLNMPEYVGSVEKIPIVAFLVWIVLTVYWMLQSGKREIIKRRKK